MKHRETILEALEFERDHWQRRLEHPRPGRKSAIKLWMRGRIAELDEVISEISTAHEEEETATRKAARDHRDFLS